MHSMGIALYIFTCPMGSRVRSYVARARIYGTDEEHVGQIDSIKRQDLAGKDEERRTGSE